HNQPVEGCISQQIRDPNMVEVHCFVREMKGVIFLQRLISMPRRFRGLSDIGPAGCDEVLDLADGLLIYKSAEHGAQKAQVGGRVVQHAGKQSAAPEKERFGRLAKSSGVCLQPVERRHHCCKNSGKQNSHLFNRMKIEMVRLMHRVRGAEIRCKSRCDHQPLAQQWRLSNEYRPEDYDQKSQVWRPLKPPSIWRVRQLFS